jgi:XTP/dITP diphosphohydrolase
MATGNPHKHREARIILMGYGLDLRRLDVKRVEIQADTLEEIAAYSVEHLPEAELRPILVEDAALFIDHLKGFPGPYSSYILKTIGLGGILKLMKDVDNRAALFRSVVALRWRGKTHLFVGEVKGEIAEEIRGSQGFGYDPIFIPEEGDGRTFGEMTTREKNTLSHRARAFRKLGLWLADQ